jgi:hypothetical protein
MTLSESNVPFAFPTLCLNPKPETLNPFALPTLQFGVSVVQ